MLETQNDKPNDDEVEDSEIQFNLRRRLAYLFDETNSTLDLQGWISAIWKSYLSGWKLGWLRWGKRGVAINCKSCIYTDDVSVGAGAIIFNSKWWHLKFTGYNFPEGTTRWWSEVLWSRVGKSGWSFNLHGALVSILIKALLGSPEKRYPNIPPWLENGAYLQVIKLLFISFTY